jgi:hypothetical protein
LGTDEILDFGEGQVKKIPDNQLYRYRLGLTYRKLNNSTRAKAELGKAIHLDPKALLAGARGIITGWKFIDQQQLQRSETLQGGLLLARRQPQTTTTNPESRDCQKYESNKCSGQV